MLYVWIANLMPLSLQISLSQGRQEYVLKARQIKKVKQNIKRDINI